jgi:hypothetical protein
MRGCNHVSRTTLTLSPLCSSLSALHRIHTIIGAALGLNANILPVFEQLGLLNELQKISFPCVDLELRHEDLRSIGSIDISGFKEK